MTTRAETVRRVHAVLAQTESRVLLCLAETNEGRYHDVQRDLEIVGRDLEVALRDLYNLLPSFIEED